MPLGNEGSRCARDWCDGGGSAFAGYYQVTYKPGPAATIVGPSNVPWNSPYVYQSFPVDRFGGSWISQDNPDPVPTPAGPGSVTCDDQIQVIFTWVAENGEPDDEPPPYVVILKDSIASWDGETGSCANGLGHPEINKVSSGLVYELFADPPAKFSRFVTPLASAEAVNPFVQPESATGSVGIRYKAYPIEIKLTGVLDAETDRRLMIGQNLGAYVSLGGLPLGTGATYLWTVSGGDPFQSYNISGGAEAATVTPFNPQTTAPLSTFLRTPADQGPFYVSCSFYWPWFGTTIALSIEGISIPPDVEYDIAIVDPELVRKLADWVFVIDEVNPNLVHLYDTPTNSVGIEWLAEVDTPYPFDNNGDGSWAIVQRVTPTREIDFLEPFDNRFNPMWEVNGRLGLDTNFPYGPFVFVANGVLDGTNDSPGSRVIDGPEYHFTHVLDSFDTYYIYRPPGSQSQYVPLRSLEWYWKAWVKHDVGAPTWVWQARESAWGWDDPPFPEHPTWSYRHDVANWTWQ